MTEIHPIFSVSMGQKAKLNPVVKTSDMIHIHLQKGFTEGIRDATDQNTAKP